MMLKKSFILKQFLLLFLILSPSLLSAETAVENIPNLPKYILHYVSAGETLHDISGYYLASPRRWREIYQLNKDKIDNTERLKPSVTLIVPFINEPPSHSTMEEYKRSIGTLPENNVLPTKDRVKREPVKGGDKGTFSVIKESSVPATEGEIEILPDEIKGAE